MVDEDAARRLRGCTHLNELLAVRRVQRRTKYRLDIVDVNLFAYYVALGDRVVDVIRLVADVVLVDAFFWLDYFVSLSLKAF